jgi:hypothetical protein
VRCSSSISTTVTCITAEFPALPSSHASREVKSICSPCCYGRLRHALSARIVLRTTVGGGTVVFFAIVSTSVAVTACASRGVRADSAVGRLLVGLPERVALALIPGDQALQRMVPAWRRLCVHHHRNGQRGSQQRNPTDTQVWCSRRHLSQLQRFTGLQFEDDWRARDESQ